MICHFAPILPFTSPSKTGAVVIVASFLVLVTVRKELTSRLIDSVVDVTVLVVGDEVVRDGTEMDGMGTIVDFEEDIKECIGEDGIVV